MLLQPVQFQRKATCYFGSDLVIQNDVVDMESMRHLCDVDIEHVGLCIKMHAYVC